MGVLYQHGIMNEPCGVKIIAFNEPSPAQDSGMQVDEIIVKINDVEINSLNHLKEYMDGYDPSMVLTIHTESNSYSIEPYLQDGRYMLGLNLTQEMCKRSFRK